MNRLVNMVLRQVARILVTKGINAGINKAANSSGRHTTAPQDKQAMSRARQSAKMARRMTRL